ncbi:MAG: peptidoglycan DD-metalloendopeptidase family protein [Chitinophagaceae bacterium]
MQKSAVLLCCLLFIGLFAGAQTSRSELEKRRQALAESLKETQEQLEATKKDHKVSMSQLNALKAKLAARERLIHNINMELNALDKDIRNSASEVKGLKSDLKVQQERYAQSIRYAYANRSSYNTLAFVFSASDFNDVLRRLKYMKKYRDFRRNQVVAIRNTQNKIEQKITVLSNAKNQKGQLLNTEEQQKTELEAEKNETNKVVEELKGREKELTADAENKRKMTKRLDNAIADAIRKEIELARKKAEEEERRRRQEEERKAAAALAVEKTGGSGSVYGSGGNKVILAGGAKYDIPAAPATGGTPNTGKTGTTAASGANNKTMAANGSGANYHPVANTVDNTPHQRQRNNYTPTATPETAELTKGFENNRGRLPWPVSSGVVVDEFGKHKHSVATRVEVENNGIDIQTTRGAKARAVFEGTVTKIISIAGLGQTILINHGKYFSVYSGLSSVDVKMGDNVNTKQSIGTVGNNEDGVSILNFQVWKGGDKMNPQSWIAPM